MIFIRAVILAGGFGRKMGNLSKSNQKTMLKIGGKPILEHIIKKLHDIGIKDIIIVVGHKKEQIIEHFGNGKSFDVKISYINKDPGFGTGLTLLEVEKFINGLFLSINGDIYFEDDLKDFFRRNEPTVCVVNIKDVSNFGKIYEKNGELINIVEKEEKGPGLINAGIYLFTPEIFDAIKLTKRSKRGEIELTDGIMVSKKLFNIKYSIHRLKGHWIDIGTPEDLERARKLFK